MFHIVAKPPFSLMAQALKAMVPSRPTDSYDIAKLFVCSLTIVWQLFVVSVRLANVLMGRIGPRATSCTETSLGRGGSNLGWSAENQVIRSARRITALIFAHSEPIEA